MIRGEVWRAQFGIPFGSEAGYKRPVLIVQDDSFNESRIRTIIVLPLTTNLRLAEAPGNVFIKKAESKLSADSVIVVAGLYALDRDRFIERISRLNKYLMLVLGIKK
ncbi:type II toxin-antitoxin system PemK/MazF family toxin [Breznakiellaceae bacterium SP9]